MNEIIVFDANTTLGIDELEARRITLIVDNLSLERIEFFRVNVTPIEGIFPVNVQNGTATVEIEDNDSKFLNKDAANLFSDSVRFFWNIQALILRT